MNCLHQSIAIVLFSMASITLSSQVDDLWSKIQQSGPISNLKMLPDSYELYFLDYESMRDLLKESDKNIHLFIPHSNGAPLEYVLEKTTFIDPSVAHLYTINTYHGYELSNPANKVSLDISNKGVRATIFSSQGTEIIEPASNGDSNTHISYLKDDLPRQEFQCLTSTDDSGIGPLKNSGEWRSPSSLRTFRLAYAASGEYSQEFGPTKTDVLNSFASAVNALNVIYKRDLGIQFMLVSTEDLVWLDPSTDPFDTSDPDALPLVNHTECTNALGSAGFDIGHLLIWDNIGGLAYQEACLMTGKGAAYSGNNLSFNQLIVDYSGHEIGHQLGAHHNFSSQECVTSVDNFRFEPGEGSSIMSYAGVCPPAASYQSRSNQFFHTQSIFTISTFLNTTATCYTTSTPGSGNSHAPVSDAGRSFFVPLETNIILVGSASDMNDPRANMTFSWEQLDGSGAETIGSPNCFSTDEPLFKFVNASPDSCRFIPSWEDALAFPDNGADWEQLPCDPRTINFMLTVRDNNADWGRTGTDVTTITYENTGPFRVTYPDGLEVLQAGSIQNITWDVAGSDINCPDVDVMIVDNDRNVLANYGAQPNNGTFIAQLPDVDVSDARVFIQCHLPEVVLGARTTFYDISNLDFSIDQSPVPLELVDFTGRQEENHISLGWITTSEINVLGFSVRKYIDKEKWIEIGFVNALNQPYANYSFKDLDPLSGTNSYQLVIENFDGSEQYSRMINVNFDGSGNFLIYPNPVSHEMTVSHIPEDLREIRIYDPLGRLMYRKSNPGKRIDMNEFSSGNYYLILMTENKTFTQKIFVSR